MRAVSSTPPSAARKPHVLTTHGDERVDEYFWLREKTNHEVTALLEAENKYADEVIRRKAGKAAGK